MDTWPGRFLLNSVGYVLVFCPILIGLFVSKKFLKLNPTIPTEKTWEKFDTSQGSLNLVTQDHQALYLKIKPRKKRILIWFYFGKRRDDDANDEEVESPKEVDLQSGESLLDEEHGEKNQSAIDATIKRKERNIFLIKALKLFACASTLWSSLIFYGLLQVGFKEKSEPRATK